MKISQNRKERKAAFQSDNFHLNALSPENKSYYQEFLGSYASQATFGNTKRGLQHDKLPRKILNEIWQAQQNGISAHSHFGLSANELALTMTKDTSKRVQKVQLIIIFIALLVSIFFTITQKDWQYLTFWIFGGGIAAINYFNPQIFNRHPQKTRRKWRYFFYLIWFVICMTLNSLLFHLSGW